MTRAPHVNDMTSYQRHVAFINALGPRLAARYTDGGARVGTLAREHSHRLARKRQRQARKIQRKAAS